MLAPKGGVEPKRHQDVVKGIFSLSFKFQKLRHENEELRFGQVGVVWLVKELKHLKASNMCTLCTHNCQHESYWKLNIIHIKTSVPFWTSKEFSKKWKAMYNHQSQIHGPAASLFCLERSIGPSLPSVRPYSDLPAGLTLFTNSMLTWFQAHST